MDAWREIYDKKCSTAEEAVKVIKSIEKRRGF